MHKSIDKSLSKGYNNMVYEKWYAFRRWSTCLEHISPIKENGKRIMVSETE